MEFQDKCGIWSIVHLASIVYQAFKGLSVADAGWPSWAIEYPNPQLAGDSEQLRDSADPERVVSSVAHICECPIVFIV
jgi:hypothetical protein